MSSTSGRAVCPQTHQLKLCTYTDGNKDGRDGAGQTNPPAKEEHTEAGYDSEGKPMVPSYVVHIFGWGHLRLCPHSRGIARLVLLS